MFKAIQEFFKGREPLQESLELDRGGQTTDRDLHIATVVILVEMAGRDEDIAQEEAEAICNTLSQEFLLPEDELPELMQIAIAARKEHGKIDEFVKILNERFNELQRQRVLAMIWKVVIADGQIDKFEQRFATQMQFRFKLTDEQAGEARAMAQEGLI